MHESNALGGVDVSFCNWTAYVSEAFLVSKFLATYYRAGVVIGGSKEVAGHT